MEVPPTFAVVPTPVAASADRLANQFKAVKEIPLAFSGNNLPAQQSLDPNVKAAAFARLRESALACQKCAHLAASRKTVVFGVGNLDAQIMFVGEAPGADEDEQGLPFVGKAGQLLDRMIAAMGLKADDVYVCNIIKCRPPGNRRPTAVETTSCIPYLNEQLANVSPKVIVAMGNTSAQTLLDTKLGITRLRGEWKLYRGKTLLMPTYHPSYLLRESPIQKLAKQEAWEDLQKVMKELGLPPPAKGTHPPGYRPPPEEAPTPSVAFPPSTKKSP